MGLRPSPTKFFEEGVREMTNDLLDYIYTYPSGIFRSQNRFWLEQAAYSDPTLRSFLRYYFGLLFKHLPWPELVSLFPWLFDDEYEFRDCPLRR
jgi:hypothetical protein